jgi:hypothetical protein
MISFSANPAWLRIRESCMQETWLCRLCGGRRLTRKRASRDPTAPGSAAQALIVTIKEDLNLRFRVLAKLRAKRPAAIVRTGARLIDRVRLCAFQ